MLQTGSTLAVSRGKYHLGYTSDEELAKLHLLPLEESIDISIDVVILPGISVDEAKIMDLIITSILKQDAAIVGGFITLWNKFGWSHYVSFEISQPDKSFRWYDGRLMYGVTSLADYFRCLAEIWLELDVADLMSRFLVTEFALVRRHATV